MQWNLRIFCLLACLLSLSGLCSGTAEAQAASEKTIHLSIVFSPGGALDTAARTLAREAEKELGQKIVVRNVPSGGGLPAVAELAHSRADGSQLAACVSNALIFLPHRNKVPYRPLTDVVPVLIFGQATPLLVTAPSADWKGVEDFLAATRRKPGTIRIGVPGLGTPSHIALAVMAAKDASLKWRFIPFGGPGEAEAALLGGHVDAAASSAVPRIQNGQLKPLITLAGKHLPVLPHIPSLADLGHTDPGKGDSSFVLLAPAGIPKAEMARLEKAFASAARSEAYVKAMESYSVTPILMDRITATSFLKDAWTKESAFLKAAGLAGSPVSLP